MRNRSAASVMTMTVLAASLVLVRAPVALATPSPTPDATAGTNGTVYAVIGTSQRIYVAGKFSWAGPYTGSGVAVDGTAGQRIQTSAQPNGPVLATASDGAGGWYLGGSFTKVGKSNRAGLARVNGTGGLAGWKAPVTGTVDAIAVAPSGTVYLGGSFSAVGGVSRQNVAAVDATGAVLPWDPGANGVVRALAISPDGDTVIAGGGFSTAGGQARDHLAAFDADGTVTAWDPGADGDVEALALSADGATVYAGGSFATIGGDTRHNIAAIDMATATAAAGWAPNPDGAIHALVVAADGDVVAGGAFTQAGSVPQTNLARYDADGQVVAWNGAAPNASVDALTVAGSTLYVGGAFTRIAGQVRARAAALDMTSGTVAAWDPRADDDVRALAASGAKVFVGGDFSMLNGAARNNVAAIDATTGEVDLSWDANANAKVRGLALSPDGGTVYIGGSFFKVGGLPRSKVAAVDAGTGAVTSWKPSANGEVRAIATAGSDVYIGGYFTAVSGEDRPYLAAVDASTGAVELGFDPAPDAGVRALETSPDGTSVYAGGDFKEIGGRARVGVGQLVPSTGEATSFAPTNGGVVLDVELSPDGSTLYCSTTSNRTFRYQPATSNTPVWEMHTGGDVQAIGATADTVYLGGHFTKFVTQNVARPRIGAIDADTMDVLDWSPGVNSFYGVWAFDVQPNALLVGGDFTRAGGREQRHLARFTGTP